jgi:hypothetical protein
MVGAYKGDTMDVGLDNRAGPWGGLPYSFKACHQLGLLLTFLPSCKVIE